MEVRIPFSGFYESMLSGAIDDEEERYIDWLMEDRGFDDEIKPFIQEWLWRHAKYHLAYNHIASIYVDPFENFINEGLGLTIRLTYKDMTSPREYNFETDKVCAEISYPDALRLARRVGRNALRKAAEDMFTSRSGFISFYDNDPAAWGPLRGWDWNQLYCLMYAALDVIGNEDWDWSIYYDLNESGEFYNAFSEAFNQDELLRDIGINSEEIKGTL